MATLYCGPTSAGGNTGIDFSNRIVCPDAAGFVRGNTYVVIGSATDYGNRDLSTAVSGTTVIIIRKANAAEDSAVAGWTTDFGTLRANFGTLFPQTDYWVINGAYRDESNWLDDSAYGIHVNGIYLANSAPAVAGNHISVSYLDVGPRAYSQTFQTGDGDAVIYCAGFDAVIEDISISRCFLHQSSFVQLAGVDGFNMEYSMLAAGYAKEAVRGQNVAKNGVIRYCVFYNSSQTNPDDDPPQGCTAEIGIWDMSANQMDNWKIYGNIFWNDKDIEHSGGCIVVGGNGGSWAGSPTNNTFVYNNTFYGIQGGFTPANVLINGGSGNEATNNLWYSCFGTPTASPNTASNGEVGNDPFVDASVGNFNLIEHIAGTSLGSPYNMDLNGNTRGADGTFDRGALQFVESAGATLDTTNLNATTLTIG